MRIMLILLVFTFTACPPYNVIASPVHGPGVQAKSQTGVAAQDKRGTQDAPLIIKGDVTTKTAEKTVEERKQKEDEIEIQRSIATYAGWLAGITFLLVVVTGVLAAFTYGLWSETQRTLTVTQRPYIKISHLSPGLASNPNLHRYKVQIKIENIGQTPARITYAEFWKWTLLATETLPADPPYTPHEEREEAFLYRNDLFWWQKVFEVSDEDFTDIESGKKILCVYGYVDYLDQFWQRHRAGYARYYHPEGTPKGDNLALVIQPGYNYDRKRQKGEGNDWGEQPN